MSTQFEDSSGEVRLSGTLLAPGATTGDVLTVQADKTVAPEAGGGSQPGVLAKDFLFTEVATAGTYSASMPVLAGTIVLDVPVYCVSGPWAADTAVFAMSDATGGVKSYYNDLDLVTLLSNAYGNGADASLGTYYEVINGGNSGNYGSVGLWLNAGGNDSSAPGV